MLKQAPLYAIVIIFFASCSSLKTAFSGKKANETQATAKSETKFLNIDVPVESRKPTVIRKTESNTIAKKETKDEYKQFEKSEAEVLSQLQVKYAVLLNTPAEEIRNTRMFEFIDDWYGTPYRLGGTSKDGVDCSAFTQTLFFSVYGYNIPRTARDQYSFTSRKSRTELKEGDLIFFRTTKGVSHVGVYLQNNKFVHASTSGGVMISDIYEDYWVRRFIGVGRLKDKEAIASSK